MPQRTHGPTTAAAKPSAPSTSPKRAPRPGKGRTNAGQRGKVAPPAPAALTASAAPDQDAGPASGAHPLAPDLIARTLRAVAGALERDPALARRVAADAGFGAPIATEPPNASTPLNDGAIMPRQRVFRPRLVTGPDAVLGPGIPDPYALRAARGEEGLRAVLEELRLGTLRAIIRAHKLDPSGRFAHQNDAVRLRALIVDATTGSISAADN